MLASGFQEPSILRIPAISRKASFPEGGFFIQSPPVRLSSPKMPPTYSRFSPSYVPPDSPFSMNKQSSREKMTDKLPNSSSDFEELMLSFKIKYKVLEEKVQNLLLENENLNEIIEKSSENIRLLQEKMQGLFEENEKLLASTKRGLLEPNLSISGLETIKRGSNNPLEKEIEGKTQIIISQNEQLNLTIREQFKELDGWKERYREKLVEFTKVQGDLDNERGLNTSLQDRIASLSQENEKINRNLLEKYAETNNFASKIKKIEEKLLDLEVENQKLRQNEGFFEKEKEEFKRHLQETYGENDRLLRLAQEREGKIQEMEELKEKVEVLVMENNKLTDGFNKLLEKHKLEKRQFQNQYQEVLSSVQSRQDLENKIRIMLAENEKLSDIIDRKNQELGAFGQLEAKIELLVGENDKLNRAISEKRNEVEYWKKRYFEQI